MPVLYSKNIEELEKNLGYTFKRKDLLLEALTHKSYLYENSEEVSNSNERLEFLGDAVLALSLSQILFFHQENLSESKMSKIRSYLVSEQILFDIASNLSLGEFLRLSKGEELTGGRSKRSLLANALEALFGAIFLDSDYETTTSLISNLYLQRVEEIITRGIGYDYKSELQERAQQMYRVLPEYKLVRQEGEEHKKIFTVEVYINNQFFGSASARSKKEAQVLAAKEALEKIEKG
ncbi:MAG: ribonuclease III [Thermodesulfovibrionales bacterium]|nr:ribonuclease III [Thermodesulfovibrionales bacterium]